MNWLIKLTTNLCAALTAHVILYMLLILLWFLVKDIWYLHFVIFSPQNRMHECTCDFFAQLQNIFHDYWLLLNYTLSSSPSLSLSGALFLCPFSRFFYEACLLTQNGMDRIFCAVSGLRWIHSLVSGSAILMLYFLNYTLFLFYSLKCNSLQSSVSQISRKLDVRII